MGECGNRISTTEKSGTLPAGPCTYIVVIVQCTQQRLISYTKIGGKNMWLADDTCNVK